MNDQPIELARLDHFGLTVPDLEEAREFFVDVLGGEVMFELGLYEPPGPDFMRTHLGVDPAAQMLRRYFIRVAGVVFEVFQYEAPDQVRTVPRNSDIGGHHVAFYVRDIDSAVANLRARGARVLEGPTGETGSGEGTRWIYVIAPWGLQLELISYPED